MAFYEKRKINKDNTGGKLSIPRNASVVPRLSSIFSTLLLTLVLIKVVHPFSRRRRQF